MVLTVDPKNVMVSSGKFDVQMNEQSGYEKVWIAKGANLNTEMRKYAGLNKKYLVLVDTSFTATFRPVCRRRVAVLLQSIRQVDRDHGINHTGSKNIQCVCKFPEMKLQNVVGVLPGKSRKNEYVIFSGHYDHLGIRGGKDRDGNVITDSIFNGANDDAAGTTAVMMLAKYFKAMNNNERTLVFVAFTAEEVGGLARSIFQSNTSPKK
jgi:acetylornithine deacetylase/succinyl-diaminopimelate desuccinylase-like protein